MKITAIKRIDDQTFKPMVRFTLDFDIELATDLKSKHGEDAVNELWKTIKESMKQAYMDAMSKPFEHERTGK